VRVLVVTNMYPSPERPELGSFVRDQVEALRELPGLEVELFAFRGGGPRAYASAARALRRRHVRERFDVVHAHYGLSGWVALALGRDAPVAVTFHGTDLSHGAIGPASRALARVADLPATASASLARSPSGPAGAGRTLRVAVLPCGADLDRFAPRERREARRRLGLEEEGRYLLFPAHPCRPEKRHGQAAALARAAGARLITYEAAEPAVVPLYVNAADAVIAPSKREGFGLAPLEALACDVPVLSTPVGIAPVALAGVAGTLCAPFDLRVWLAALAPHLEDRDPRIDGRARAALFDRRRMAERVARAYGELARPAASPTRRSAPRRPTPPALSALRQAPRSAARARRPGR
jgi:teichuronic acid biosynthesis glycosyltransferase TuaC